MSDVEIYTSEGNPGDVLIHLTYPSSSTGEATARLSIEDQMSSQVVVRVELNADQLLSLMRSAGTYVSGAQFAARLDLVGKRRQNTSVSVMGQGDGDIDERAAKVASGLAAEWQHVRIDRTNFGRRVVAYRWIEDGTDEQ